jgi:uncharacterized membrane protein (Fun14 family)
MDELKSELATLRASDKARGLSPKERESNVRRKAELKHIIKSGVLPPPSPPPSKTDQASAMFQSAMETASSVTGGMSLPSTMSFPSFTPPGEDEMTHFAGVIGFGSATGFCTGYALKKAGRAAATTAGLIFMALTAAEQKGYIDVRWDNIERDTVGQMDLNQDGKIDSEDAKIALAQFTNYMTTKNSAVTSSTFTAGLLYGLRKG